MIQIGGLGVISVASFLSMLAGRKISLMQRQTMQNALSAPQMGGIVKLTRFIFLVSFAIEGIGALLLMPVFMTKYGIRGIWMAVFHSVSAFCNAGFDLMGNQTGQYSSLTSFAGSGYVTLVICLLIMIGGIGFHLERHCCKENSFQGIQYADKSHISYNSNSDRYTGSIFLLFRFRK